MPRVVPNQRLACAKIRVRPLRKCARFAVLKIQRHRRGSRSSVTARDIDQKALRPYQELYAWRAGCTNSTPPTAETCSCTQGCAVLSAHCLREGIGHCRPEHRLAGFGFASSRGSCFGALTLRTTPCSLTVTAASSRTVPEGQTCPAEQLLMSSWRLAPSPGTSLLCLVARPKRWALGC